MIEATVEDHFCKRVKETGGDHRKVSWIGRKGAPDRFAFWPDGGHAFVELKRPGRDADPHQARELKRLRNAKLPCFVLSTIAEVDGFIWLMTGVR